MSGSSLAISRQAERDLASVFDWLAQAAGPDTAEEAILRIERTFEMLAASPLAGRRRDDLAGVPRSYVVRPWVVFYEPLADRPGVLILRVIDGRRDVPNHIR